MFYPKTSRDGDAGDCRAYPLNHWCWISRGSMLDSRACLVQSVDRLSCHMLWGSRMPDLGLESHQCLCCTRDESEESITYRWWSTQAKSVEVLSSKGIQPGFETLGRPHQKSKTGYRGPTKRTRVLQFFSFSFFKKRLLVGLFGSYILSHGVSLSTIFVPGHYRECGNFIDED